MQRKINIKKITLMGLLFSLALILSVFESMLPVLPGMPPGVKLGLSNIVTMYCLFCLGFKESLIIALLKSAFVFLMRGIISASISLSGGLLSVIIMLVFIFLSKSKLSELIVSILGGIFHNVGQLIIISFYMGTNIAFYYLPVLLISGFFMGLVTGIVVKTVMPYIKNTCKQFKL